MLWYVLAGLGALGNPDRRGLYARAAGTVLLAFCLNQFVKLFVRRGRPELEGLAPLIPTHSLYGLACTMALTRPYLGVHYPSDTLAGAGLGWAAARLLS